MSKLEYEDRYKKAKIEAMIDLQMKGEILVEIYNQDYNLPCLTKIGLSCMNSPRGYIGSVSHQYDVRFTGKTDVIGYADYDSNISAYKFIPVPGAELPPSLAKYQPLQIAEVEVDEEARVATIRLGEKMLTFSDVEVWRENNVLIVDINKVLQNAKSNVVVWKLTRIPAENSKPKLYKGGAPSLSNNQVTLPVSGYAVNHYGIFAYLGVVGHKTAVNSVWATLIQSKPLNLFGIGRYQALNVGTSKYTRLMAPMPDYDSHNCNILSNQALPGKWSPEDSTIFLLQFINGENIESQLVGRLNESLPLPVLPDWGASLMQHGALKGFIKEMDTGGDCLCGVEIQIDADWTKLVEDLILAEELAI